MPEVEKELSEAEKVTQEFVEEFKKLCVKYKRDFKPILQSNEQAIFVNLKVISLEEKV